MSAQLANSTLDLITPTAGARSYGLHTADASDLAQVIEAYNQTTRNLQFSHEKLESEIVRLRRELASTNAQLQRSKRLSALGEMAAGIAHEIRNPLGAIQLYLTMVIEDLETTDAPSARVGSAIENVRKIASAVRGLNAIVSDVLTFAREIQPQRQWVSAQAILDRALETHRPAIEAAKVSVKRSWISQGGEAGASSVMNVHEGRDDGLTPIHVDPDLMHQAALNLIRNAVEAMSRTDSGDRPRVLTLDARIRDGEGMLMVRDTGLGIAEADIDRIFNPFFTTRSSGTGLGLAIVHRILDAHGGAITVENDAVGGAIFQLTLPVGGSEGINDPDK